MPPLVGGDRSPDMAAGRGNRLIRQQRMAGQACFHFHSLVLLQLLRLADSLFKTPSNAIPGFYGWADKRVSPVRVYYIPFRSGFL